MARFYFHLSECGTVTPDREGREFSSLATAHTAAIKDARAIMCAELSEGSLCLACYIDIADADGECLDRLAFRDAVTITGQ